MENATKPVTVCLNMIVKNEGKIITRLLDSVIDFIDSFCIVDTGSSDNTVDIIMDYFNRKQIMGRLGFTEFVNFEKTRNEAIQMANGLSDYLLLMDADMVLEHSIDKNKLKKDYYAIFQENNQIRYHNTRIIKNNGNFYYRGVTHEVVLSNKNVSGDLLDDTIARIIDYEDGGSKDNKLERDKRLLLDNLEDQETQSRYYFYLANTLIALGDKKNAIEYYIKRIKKGGWKQELWCSCYKLGCIYYLEKDFTKAMFYFLEAYNYDPDRVENLFYLVTFYKQIDKLNISNIYLNLSLNILKNKKFDKGDLFLEMKFYNRQLWEDI